MPQKPTTPPKRLIDEIPPEVWDDIIKSFTWVFTNGFPNLMDKFEQNHLTDNERQEVKDLLKTHGIQVDVDSYTSERTLLEAIKGDVISYLESPNVDYRRKNALVEGLDSILETGVVKADFIGKGVG